MTGIGSYLTPVTSDSSASQYWKPGGGCEETPMTRRLKKLDEMIFNEKEILRSTSEYIAKLEEDRDKLVEKIHKWEEQRAKTN
jgi:hypothetical protein